MSEIQKEANRRNFDPDSGPEASRAITRAAGDVVTLLEQHGLDSADILLRGSLHGHIPEADQTDDELAYFGSVDDLFPSNGRGDVGDAWAANPLKYALEYGDRGVISVYNRSNITPHQTEPDEDDYGTVIAKIDDNLRGLAPILDINVVTDPQIISLTQSEYDMIDWGGDISDGQTDVGGIPISDKIVKIEITDQNGQKRIEYRDTSHHDFGNVLKNVVEVGGKDRSAEITGSAGLVAVKLEEMKNGSWRTVEFPLNEKSEDAAAPEDAEDDKNVELIRDLKREISDGVGKISAEHAEKSLEIIRSIEEVIEDGRLRPSQAEAASHELRMHLQTAEERLVALNKRIVQLSDDIGREMSKKDAKEIDERSGGMIRAANKFGNLLNDSVVARVLNSGDFLNLNDRDKKRALNDTYSLIVQTVSMLRQVI